MVALSLSTIYLLVLLIIGAITILYLFIGDIGAEGIPFLDPAVILSFITLTAAGGYLFERYASFSSWLHFFFALGIALILTWLFYFFLLIPMRSAEATLAYTDESLEGQVGRVIVPIPLDGFGELVIEGVSGVISKRAASFHQESIDYNEQVLIIEMKDGTAYVTKYER